MFIKLLFGSIATGGVVGGAVAAGFVLTNQRGSDKENTHLEPEVKREEETEIRSDKLKRKPKPQPQSVSIEEQKLNFVGVLVFSRESEDSPQVNKIGNVLYKGEIFTNDEYQKKQEEWNKPEDSGDSEKEEDPDAHIKVDLPLGKAKKPEQELKNYLAGLNKKIKGQTNGTNLLDKLEKSLEEDESEFKENFGDQTYNELIQKIQDLRGNKRQ